MRLVAYLHTEDPRRIYRRSCALAFGMFAVNRTKVTHEAVGLGREGARLGMKAFIAGETCLRDWS